MTIYTENHDFAYEVENVANLFFPNDKNTVINIENRQEDNTSTDYIHTCRQSNNNGDILSVRVHIGSFDKEESDFLETDIPDREHEAERRMAVCMYRLLSEYTGKKQPWGILTGVRPIKLMRRLKNSLGSEEAEKYFVDKLLVSKEKARLSVITEQNEQKILSLSRPDSFSLYVSIPFCPSRCSYCSFVSQSIERAAALIEPYLNLLCKEIAYTAQIAKECNLRLETVYIGGGTPTTLTAPQLGQLIESIQQSFDMPICREFTVEAGRPDTIDSDKLHIMYNHGIDRISINPQTLNDSVLRVIGRKHTAQQTLDAYNLAKQIGFRHINMDLIAGLPTDTYESFEDTLNKICMISPASITVHTLAKKRSSGLSMNGTEVNMASPTASMLEYCEHKLSAESYHPYYLYRQSRMAGNLENVGWSKEGFDGLYNVYIMDETHTILGCGAGAVSKLKNPYNESLSRIFNYKYPYEYINGFDEMLKRKVQVKTFYEQLS